MPTIVSRQPSSHISRQVPSIPMVTVATGSSGSGRAYSQSSSLASATAATASATSCTKQRATVRPWFSARSLITRAEPNSAYLCETILANLGVELTDDPGVAVERAVGLAAPAALVDVPLDRGDAVGGLVLLEELALAGQLGVADLDRRAVGVEPLEDLLVARTPASLRRCWMASSASQHGGAVGDLDLDGEGGLGAGDDGGGHGDLRGSGGPSYPVSRSQATSFEGHTLCEEYLGEAKTYLGMAQDETRRTSDGTTTWHWWRWRTWSVTYSCACA